MFGESVTVQKWRILGGHPKNPIERWRNRKNISDWNLMTCLSAGECLLVHILLVK